MIRVLQVVNRMGYGGIESFLMNIYRTIDKNKIQFDFAVHSDKPGEYDEEIKKLGGRIFYFHSRREGVRKYYKDWKNFLKKNGNNYKAIHMHVSSLTTILPIKLAKKYGIKNRIMHAHNTLQRGKLHNILNIINQKKINRYSNSLLACSTEAGKYVFGKNKFDLCHNGIQVNKYIFNKTIREEVRKKLKIADDELAIVNVGRLVYEKNQKFLIDIFECINKLNPKAKMFLIGEGNLREELENIVIEKKLQDKIQFLGTKNDVYEILQGMDAFVFPSIFEGLPVTLIEAQASGIKIFASDAISKETKISDLVKFIPLSETANEWAKIILSEREFKRVNMGDFIRKAGYDIKCTVDIVSKIYDN